MQIGRRQRTSRFGSTLLLVLVLAVVSRGSAAARADVAKTVSDAVATASRLREADKPDEALDALRAAARTVKEKVGPRVPELLPIYDLAAEMLLAADDPEKSEKADRLLGKIVAIREQIFDEGDASQAGPLGESLLLLSGVRSSGGKLQPALDAAKQAVIVLDTSFGPDHEASVRAVAAVSKTLAAFDDTLGVDHEATFSARSSAISLQESLGHYREAIQARKSRMDSLRKRLGPDHPQTLEETERLSRLLLASGRAAEAIPTQKTAVEGWRVIASRDSGTDEDGRRAARADPRVIGARRLLGELALASEQFSLAERMFAEAHAANVALHGADDPDSIIDSLHSLDVARRSGAGVELATVAGLADTLRAVPYNGRGVGSAARGLIVAAKLLVRLGDASRARDCVRHVTDLAESTPAAQLDPIVTRVALGEALLAQGGHGEAIPLLEEAVWDAERSHGSGDIRTLAAVLLLARAFAADGDQLTAAYLVERVLDRRVPRPDAEFEAELTALVDDASDALEAQAVKTGGPAGSASAEKNSGGPPQGLRERLLELRGEQFGDTHACVGITAALFGRWRAATGDWEAATRFLETAGATETKALGEGHPEVAGTRLVLADVLRRAGKVDAAGKAASQALAAWERAAGPNHRGTLAAVQTLTLVKLDAGDATAAIPLLERLRDVRARPAEKSRDPRALARVLVRLAALQTGAGGEGRGRAAAEAALAVDCWSPAAAASAADVTEIVTLLATLSMVFDKLGLEPQAAETLQRAREVATGLDSPRKALARINQIITEGRPPADLPL